MKTKEIIEAMSQSTLPMSNKYTNTLEPTSLNHIESAVQKIEMRGIKPKLQNVPTRLLRSTQDWLDHDEGGSDPVFYEYVDYPVMLKDGEYYHIIDGHHRTYKALDTNKQTLTAYIFDAEQLSNTGPQGNNNEHN